MTNKKSFDKHTRTQILRKPYDLDTEEVFGECEVYKSNSPM